MNNRVGSTINRIYIYSVRFERCDLCPMIYLVYYHNIIFFPLSQTYGNLLISDFFHRPVRSGRIVCNLFIFQQWFFPPLLLLYSINYFAFRFSLRVRCRPTTDSWTISVISNDRNGRGTRFQFFILDLHDWDIFRKISCLEAIF